MDIHRNNCFDVHCGEVDLGAHDAHGVLRFIWSTCARHRVSCVSSGATYEPCCVYVVVPAIGALMLILITRGRMTLFIMTITASAR